MADTSRTEPRDRHISEAQNARHISAIKCAPIKPRDAYRPALKIVMPLCPPDQIEARCALMLFRDKATQRRRICPPESGKVWEALQELCVDGATAVMSTEHIKQLRWVAIKIGMAGASLDALAERIAAA